MSKQNKVFEEMTVAELREESKNRGLVLQSKGKKYTKCQLIGRIISYDETEATEVYVQTESIKKVTNNKIEKPDDVTTCGNKPVISADIPLYGKTLSEIEQRYSERKKEWVYQEELKVGCFVAFVHYVQASNGTVYKKLRTAKVVAVSRGRELVKVVTLLGTDVVLCFEDLLYIKSNDRNSNFPVDISTYLRKQRTEKGRALMDERFIESFGTN